MVSIVISVVEWSPLLVISVVNCHYLIAMQLPAFVVSVTTVCNFSGGSHSTVEGSVTLCWLLASHSDDSSLLGVHLDCRDVAHQSDPLAHSLACFQLAARTSVPQVSSGIRNPESSVAQTKILEVGAHD